MAVSPVNGVRMHYERMPAAQPHRQPAPVVVFIHGLGTDSLASFYLTLAAPVAAAGIDVIAYDLRGHGRSEVPPTGYRVADFVADLVGLLDELAIPGPVHLVGNSFGGTIAFSVAAEFPERVASIVSIESEPATETWAAKMTEVLDNTTKEFRKESFFEWLTETSGAHITRLARAAAKRLLATSMATEVPQGPLLGTAGLARIRCPVLSILGDAGFQKDDLTGLEAALPDCTTEVIPGQDHSVLVIAHKAVRQLVLGWIGEHSTPGRVRLGSP